MKGRTTMRALGMGVFWGWFDSAVMGSQVRLRLGGSGAPMESFVLALAVGAMAMVLASVFPKAFRSSTGSRRWGWWRRWRRRHRALFQAPEGLLPLQWHLS